MDWTDFSGPLDVLGGIYAVKSNEYQAQKNRDFQEWMSSTQMQRRVKDLRAAGLNPMLAINQGGAAMGSGAMAKIENPAAGLSKHVSNAIQAKVASETVRKIEADRKLVEEQIKGTQNQNRISNIDAWIAENTGKWKVENMSLENAVKLEQYAQSKRLELALKKEELIQQKANSSSAQAVNNLRKRTAEIDKKLAELDALLKRLPSVGGSGFNSFSTDGMSNSKGWSGRIGPR